MKFHFIMVEIFNFIPFISSVLIVVLHNFFEHLHQLYLLCSMSSINYSAVSSAQFYLLHVTDNYSSFNIYMYIYLIIHSSTFSNYLCCQ
jgi:hypothetical protein